MPILENTQFRLPMMSREEAETFIANVFKPVDLSNVSHVIGGEPRYGPLIKDPRGRYGGNLKSKECQGCFMLPSGIVFWAFSVKLEDNPRFPDGYGVFIEIQNPEDRAFSITNEDMYSYIEDAKNDNRQLY